jgi:hypothetical protein
MTQAISAILPSGPGVEAALALLKCGKSLKQSSCKVVDDCSSIKLCGRAAGKLGP